jgi:hypothetical protein
MRNNLPFKAFSPFPSFHPESTEQSLKWNPHTLFVTLFTPFFAMFLWWVCHCYHHFSFMFVTGLFFLNFFCGAYPTFLRNYAVDHHSFSFFIERILIFDLVILIKPLLFWVRYFDQTPAVLGEFCVHKSSFLTHFRSSVTNCFIP